MAWGAEVDSQSGREGAPLTRSGFQLVHLLSLCLRNRGCIRELLQSILGSVVRPFTHRPWAALTGIVAQCS